MVCILRSWDWCCNKCNWFRCCLFYVNSFHCFLSSNIVNSRDSFSSCVWIWSDIWYNILDWVYNENNCHRFVVSICVPMAYWVKNSVFVFEISIQINMCISYGINFKRQYFYECCKMGFDQRGISKYTWEPEKTRP